MITKKYKIIDNIKVFIENVPEDHQDYNARGLDNLYKQEEKHFWFIARKEFILKNIKKYINQNERIIEVGAGTGNVSRYLMKNGYQNIAVGEMHYNGLRYAKNYGIQECYQFNLIDVPFEEEFDAVCMFDVLEHLEDDELALKNVYKMLKTNGKVIITVPAHMWLWGEIDRISGHKTRYNKRELEEKLKITGFDIIFSKYFFITIVPLLFLRKILYKDDGQRIETNDVVNIDIGINKFVNTVLLFICRLENRLIKILPNFCGGSLLVIGIKKCE